MKQLRPKLSIFLCTLSFFLIIASLHPQATASENIYPTKGWKSSTPEAQGIRSQMLADMIDVIKAKDYGIDSVLIIRNGYMVLDAYFHPFSKDHRHNIHSCTKSIMSILIGIAIDKGHIKGVHQPVTDFFPDKTIVNMDDNKKSMTLEHLLTMTSGLDCRDSRHYDYRGLHQMHSSDDWAQHVLDLPMAGPPGQHFEYCNGVSYLLSAIIQRATGMKTLDFANTHLFHPLGITEIVWDRSPQGIDIGYGRMWLKPHDMAKIGWLYINKGKWGQRQIVSPSWVELSTRGHVESKPAPLYGYQWWVDSDGKYAALGRYGQNILVAADINMVVVFTGDLPDEKMFIALELTRDYIVPAVAGSESLPANAKDAARLDDLVRSVSTTYSDGFTWLSRDAGLAKDGLFRRKTDPKFTFAYPVGSKKLSTTSYFHVMRMKTPDEVHFAASVIDIPNRVKLEDFGPKFYARYLQGIGSNISIVANKEKKLACGTRAYRTDIKWTYDDYLQVTSLVVSAYKDNKCVYLVVHAGPNHEKFAPIVESLTFE